MVSRENTVIVVFGAVALVSSYALDTLTSVGTTVAIGVLLLLGVLLPQALNTYLDSRESE